MTPEEFKKLQKKAGLTNQAAAELLGVSLPTISKWRNGTRRITTPMETLIKYLFGQKT